jgi:Na+-driven multidrug efflux pump
VRLFTREADVAAVAVQNLRIEMIGQIFYAIFMIYHGFALGAGHTWFVLLSSFVNCILVRVVLVILLDQALGLTGVFLACMIAPASSVPIGICYVKSGIWRKKLNL